MTAPYSGIVICLSKLPLVNEGEALFHLAQFDQASSVEDEIATHVSNVEDDKLYEVEAVPVIPVDQEDDA